MKHTDASHCLSGTTATAREGCQPFGDKHFNDSRNDPAGRLHLKDAPVLGAHADERCTDGRSEVFPVLEGASYVPCMGPEHHNQLWQFVMVLK